MYLGKIVEHADVRTLFTILPILHAGLPNSIPAGRTPQQARTH